MSIPIDSPNKGKTVVLYDGDCVLCNFWISIIKKNKHSAQFRCLSLQSWMNSGANNSNTEFKELGDYLQHSFTKLPDSVIVLKDKRIFMESDAVLVVIRQLAGPVKFLLLGYAIPKGIRNILYRWVAKNRYRWFGRKNTC
jgi:predicted DCC family thiol-disulfide oxidoreductase YuxK